MLKIAIASLFLFSANLTMACSCLPVPEVAGELERSVLVVDGTVLAIEDRHVGWRKLKNWFKWRFGPPFPSSADDGFAIRLKAHQVWKGKAMPELVVYTPRDEAACGFRFQLGQRYVVYAQLVEDDQLEASLCSRTRLRRENGEGTTLDELAASKKF